MGVSMRATKAFEGNMCWYIFVPIQYVNTKSLVPSGDDEC